MRSTLHVSNVQPSFRNSLEIALVEQEMTVAEERRIERRKKARDTPVIV